MGRSGRVGRRLTSIVAGLSTGAQRRYSRVLTMGAACSFVCLVATVLLCARSYEKLDGVTIWLSATWSIGFSSGRGMVLMGITESTRVDGTPRRRITLETSELRAIRRETLDTVFPLDNKFGWDAGSFVHRYEGWRLRNGSVWFPHWALALALGVLPVWWAQSRLLCRYYRRRLGLCVMCGYDLTGNESGRCPECGEAVSDPGGLRQPS